MQLFHPDTRAVGQHEALVMSRFWFNRHKRLPWWRFIAKREAYENAEAWGALSKRLHEEQEAVLALKDGHG